MNRSQRRHGLKALPSEPTPLQPPPASANIGGFWPCPGFVAVFEKPRTDDSSPIERIISEVAGIMLLNQQAGQQYMQSFHGIAIVPPFFRFGNPEAGPVVVNGEEYIFVGYAREDQIERLKGPRLALPQ